MIFLRVTGIASRTGRWLKDAGLLLYVKPYYLIAEEQTISFYKLVNIPWFHQVCTHLKVYFMKLNAPFRFGSCVSVGGVKRISHTKNTIQLRIKLWKPQNILDTAFLNYLIEVSKLLKYTSQHCTIMYVFALVIYIIMEL